MRKAARRKESRRNGSAKRERHENVIPVDFEARERFQPTAKELKPKNADQKHYISTIRNFTVTVGIGEAGTGKTFIPSVLAAQELATPGSVYEKFILVRPNEPLGKSLGMLPGDLNEKMAPWLEPIADGFKWALGERSYQGLVERKAIQYLAIEHARGRTFNNSYVIVDEAQNISVEAMKCILTRVGQDCKLVICGDVAQKDIKSDSGLQLIMDIYDQYEHVPFSLVELHDNVRSAESKAFQAIFNDMGI